MKQMRLALNFLFENFNLGFGYEGLNAIVLVLCRDTLSLYTQFAGMCLGTFWHLLLRTLSKSGTWAWVVMESVYELNCNGNNFHACVFHPNYPSLLFIGCYQVSVSAVCATQCMPDTNLFLALSAALGMSAIMWKCIMECTGHCAQ
jgi:hypothetical protein